MSRVWELREVKASSQICDSVAGRGRGGGRGAACSYHVGVTNCRRLEPAISRLWGKCVSTRLVRMDQFIYCTIWDWFYATLRCYKVIIKIIWRESDKKRRVPKTSSYNLFFFFLTSHQICDQKVTNNKKKNTKAYAFLFIIWNKRQRDPRSRKVRRQF